MSYKQKRSSSMGLNKCRCRNNDYDEEKCYEINPYQRRSPIKNNYQNEIVNFFPMNIFEKVGKGEINVGFVQTNIKHPDGRNEFTYRVDISKNNPRKIINTYTETKTVKKKDFDIQTQTKSYQTGLIFKDTHYYETQKVIPKVVSQKYQRTVTQYSDGTSNYGDWRPIN